MKISLVSLIILYFTGIQVHAQNKAWILAPNYSPDITLGTNLVPLPTTLGGYQSQPANGAQNIITNSSDEIMFFIVDENIYGRNGELIDVLEVGMGSGEYVTGINSEVVVVPDPDNCNLFHLLSTQNLSGTITEAKAYYALLKISYNSQGQVNANSGLVYDDPNDCYSDLVSISGMVGTVFNSNNGGPNNPHNESPLYAVSPKLANGTHKVFVQNARKLFVFTIANGSFTYDNTVVDLFSIYQSSLNTLGDNGDSRELEVVQLSNGDLRLGFYMSEFTYIGLPFAYSGVGTIDFTTNGQFITGSQTISDYRSDQFTFPNINQSFTEITGLEFSPDGSNLFVSHMKYGANNATLDYWNLNSTPVKTELSTNDEYQYSQIEVAIDNNVYLSKQNYLSKITTPNGIPVLNENFLPIPNYSTTTGNVTNKVRLMQDQIDGYDYSMISPAEYNAYVFDVTSSGTWSPNTISNSYNNNPLIYGLGNTAVIEKELRIKAGATLTINNLNIEFSPGARIVVENGSGGQQGGKLIANNCVFTNAKSCGENEMWLGVEVWGNQTQTQGSMSSSTQGRFSMNNTRIENAYVGVLLTKRKSIDVIADSYSTFCEGLVPPQYNSVVQLFTFDNTRNGGVVQTYNSEFLNDQRGAWFRPYVAVNGANNLSRFYATDFSWDDNLLTSVQDHILLTSVKGISVKGCHLSNNKTGGNGYLLGFGINATQSQFYVSPFCPVSLPYGQPCPSQQATVFENLQFGIKTINILANTFTFSCKESEFVNNRYGIHVTGTKSERIQLNSFEIRELDNQQSAGIALYNSDKYYVQENTLFNFDDPMISLTDVGSYGIVVVNSGEGNNEIYKNYFHDLKIGGQTERINAVAIDQYNQPIDSFYISGLQWRCNDYQSNIDEQDMTLMWGRMHFNHGVASGATTSLEARRNAANNEFSLIGEPMPDAHDIFISDYSQQINYVHLAIPEYTPDSYSYANNWSQNIMSTQVANWGNVPITDDTDACPSKISKKIVGVSYPLLNGIIVQIDSLLNLIDGGNTEYLLSVIEGGSNGNTKDILLDVSPYLSDEVLIAYLNSNPPAGHVYQVLYANSELSPAVKEYLLSYSMPNGTANQIEAAQSIQSERELLYDRVNWLQYQFDLEYNDLISQLLLDDSDTATVAVVVSVLRDFQDYERLKAILAVYISVGDTNRAQLARQELVAMNPCQYYLELCDIAYDITSNRCIKEALIAEPTLESRAESLVINSTDEWVVESAQCMLDSRYDIVDVPEFLTANSSNRMMLEEPEERKNLDLSRDVSALLYPNPSDGMVYFDIDLAQYNEVSIEVFTANGKRVHLSVLNRGSVGELDLSQLDQGIYLVQVRGDGITIITEKVKIY